MSIYALKPRFQQLLRPPCGALHRRGISANQVTLAACVCRCCWACCCVRFGGFAALVLAAAAVVFLRMALNAVDGMLAREFGQQSALGGYLNEITDVAADAAFICRLPLLRLLAACKMAC